MEKKLSFFKLSNESETDLGSKQGRPSLTGMEKTALFMSCSYPRCSVDVEVIGLGHSCLPRGGRKCPWCRGFVFCGGGGHTES